MSVTENKKRKDNNIDKIMSLKNNKVNFKDLYKKVIDCNKFNTYLAIITVKLN